MAPPPPPEVAGRSASVRSEVVQDYAGAWTAERGPCHRLVYDPDGKLTGAGTWWTPTPARQRAGTAALRAASLGPATRAQTTPPGILPRPRYLAPLCPQWHLLGAVLTLPGCRVVPNPHRLARRRVGEDFARRLRRLAGNLAATSVTVPAEERKHDPDDHDRYDHPIHDAQWGPLYPCAPVGSGGAGSHSTTRAVP